MRLSKVFENDRLAGSYIPGEDALIRALPAGSLCVDVGAHLGINTEAYIRAGHHAVCFEPNPANLPYLRARLAPYEGMWELHEKAVSSRTDRLRFTIPYEVEVGNTSIAADFVGSSSGGTLGKVSTPSAKTIEVDTVRLDDVIDQPIDYLKVDVQGQEFEVLSGAKRLLTSGAISYMQLEFLGRYELVELVRDAGFYIFDQKLYQTGKYLENVEWDGIPVTTIREGTLTSDAMFRIVSVPNRPRELREYASFVSLFIGWTDLFCVHESRMAAFTEVVSGTADQL